ncbi:MAG: hypothetical protein ACETVZ_04560, partial [Phycisphaerae bacterium]
MLSLKSKNWYSFLKAKNKVRKSQASSVKVTLLLVLLCCWALMLLCWSAGHSFSAPPAPVEISKSESAEPNPPWRTEVPESPSSPPRRIEAACQLIYQGKFDAAAELIKQTSEDDPNELSLPVADQLLEIMDKYQALGQQRQSARQDAYQSAIGELAELEKLRAAADTNDVSDVTVISDANDANDITEVLSIIAKASELADAEQKTELLSAPFVKQVFQKAIDKAAEFELQGKWLDAYISCYAWLQTIDPKNEAYSDYAEELLDKAGIIASFQDSPCETRQERFHGIKKEMFIRTIDALNVHYVSDIDYSQMASEAIRRCELLAEVTGTSFPQDLLAEGSENSFSPPDANEITAFSAALATLLDEVESTLSGQAGFDKDKFIEVFERV